MGILRLSMRMAQAMRLLIHRIRARTLSLHSINRRLIIILRVQFSMGMALVIFLAMLRMHNRTPVHHHVPINHRMRCMVIHTLPLLPSIPIPLAMPLEMVPVHYHPISPPTHRITTPTTILLVQLTDQVNMWDHISRVQFNRPHIIPASSMAIALWRLINKLGRQPIITPSHLFIGPICTLINTNNLRWRTNPINNLLMALLLRGLTSTVRQTANRALLRLSNGLLQYTT